MSEDWSAPHTDTPPLLSPNSPEELLAAATHLRHDVEQRFETWRKRSNYLLSVLDPAQTLEDQMKSVCASREYRNLLAPKPSRS